MRKAYKFKLYKNKRRERRLENELYQFHLIYNHCIRLIRTHYRLFGENPSKSDLQKHLSKLMSMRFKFERKQYSHFNRERESTTEVDPFLPLPSQRQGGAFTLSFLGSSQNGGLEHILQKSPRRIGP